MKRFTGWRWLLLLAAFAPSLLAIRPSADARPLNLRPHEAPPVRPAPAQARPEVLSMNAWTVGLAGGLLEGAPIRLAAEIARVVDDGDNLHVLPVVTRGPAGRKGYD